jgi:hypothetical protein
MTKEEREEIRKEKWLTKLGVSMTTTSTVQ